ncbi:RdRP-domain-containing protein [Dichomitus squalens]|uniref:RNA-dependent RNA polymerase n=1 Tax=Dichomitus squalens TaxID=114155 RepID=A0A4Q9N3J6_9APHY|nr:RdRP-domain-containing protein [Dichomitus squalens]
MEIYMKNIPASTKDTKLKLELAAVLHAPPFRNPSEELFNFGVFLIQQRKRGPWRTGFLTLPSNEIAELFLQTYGGPSPRHSFVLDTTRVQFQVSNRGARPQVLERIRREPFQDPREAFAREQREAELQALQVRISTIQFGWECRDQVYSVEWETACHARLAFDGERREFRVRMDQGGLFSDTRIIAIRVSQIYYISATVDNDSRRPTIVFSLIHPPALESESTLSQLASLFSSNAKPPRQRWSSFNDSDDLAAIMPYVSLSIRLECESVEDLRNFREFADAAHTRVGSDLCPVERRGLFSDTVREDYSLWIQRLPWTVAFQIEALLRSWLLNMREALSLRDHVERVLRAKGRAYTAALLRDFTSHAKALYWYGEAQPGAEPSLQTHLNASWSDPVTHLFQSVEAQFVYKPVAAHAPAVDAPATFQCFHVSITPTTMILEGPFPERSNRVIRMYWQNEECFLRVSFQDENRLQFRFDREVDGRSFINRRFRGVLRDGITIAGAHFSFLAYSQSALKEHAVWFVKPFRHRDGHGVECYVDATTIIENLGNFRVSFDTTLIHCPARYAARIAQAFTATDASITVDVDQIERGEDLEDATGNYCFTDGVGTISRELAREIWRSVRERGRRSRPDRTYPRAYQVRFQGSKGMLSVDHTLSGRKIVIRPSMTKFEANQSSTIEVARAFDRPGPYFLNRPLIMLLEGLGVSYETLQALQDAAVYDAQQSVTSLERSARLLEAHGLGVSFRLTSAMLGLHKLGLDPLNDDVFWRQAMDFAINHVLRELKHHARIPVPSLDSWTLVGVADVHGELQEGEIFACIDSPTESCLIYLEGPCLISRSPTIHPGDVQVVHAIGRPPAGSALAKESLRNTVVFSIQGERPLPSCLGGGDLDGDLYNVTTRRDLLPSRTYEPASYEPATKKLVEHECTMEDVADFVAEYISSDTLGIIATTWLKIADQSADGILDQDCLKLAALHSHAVDYPKSGQPVPVDQIPKLKSITKPDWSAPETISRGNEDYYPSTKAIGKLFRSIDLPAVQTVQRVARRQRRHMHNANQDDEYADVLELLHDETPMDDRTAVAVQERISEFISPDEYDGDFIRRIWDLYKSYTSQLRAICADHTLEHKRSAMLTEEEVVIGTIVAKCSQPRKRKDLMSQMREQTATLVSSVKEELSGDDEIPPETSLQRAWIAYKLANIEGEAFGARSFSWVALGSIFDAIKEIEDEDRALARR